MTEMILRMTMMPDLVTEATAEMRRALGDSLNSDWNVLAGDLEWSCRGTAAHVADDLFSYASQILAQPSDSYLPIEATVLDEATPEDLLRSIAMCGELLRLAAASAPRDVRAWHPYGTSDPEGFAAMGIVEVLVHTHDIAGGLGTIDIDVQDEASVSAVLDMIRKICMERGWLPGGRVIRRAPSLVKSENLPMRLIARCFNSSRRDCSGCCWSVAQRRRDVCLRWWSKVISLARRSGKH